MKKLEQVVVAHIDIDKQVVFVQVDNCNYLRHKQSQTMPCRIYVGPTPDSFHFCALSFKIQLMASWRICAGSSAPKSIDFSQALAAGF